ncbi:hypothetical protein K8R03_03465 [Candidatus Kaiserbacteria bacterium]|nr:hypothetical protein [Candidatus Kaiserbacteria bacterium]
MFESWKKRDIAETEKQALAGDVNDTQLDEKSLSTRPDITISEEPEQPLDEGKGDSADEWLKQNDPKYGEAA